MSKLGFIILLILGGVAFTTITLMIIFAIKSVTPIAIALLFIGLSQIIVSIELIIELIQEKKLRKKINRGK